MPDPSLIKQVLKMVGHTKKLLPFIINSTHLDWAKKSYKFRPLRYFLLDSSVGGPKRGYSTPETRFSEPRFSEILDLMNKLHLTFSYFTVFSYSI